MRSLKTVNIIFFPTLRLPNIRIFVSQYFTSVTSQRLRTAPIKLLLVHNHLPQIITKINEVNLLSASSDGQNLLNTCIFQFKAKRAQELIPGIPVILCTGFVDDIAVDDDRFAQVMSKPYEAVQLADEIRREVTRVLHEAEDTDEDETLEDTESLEVA